MIIGIGTDIVNIKRIENILNIYGNKFINRIFTKEEIKYCTNHLNSANFFAKRFAAKEAVLKALGTGLSKGISFSDIEIKKDYNKKPIVSLNSKAMVILNNKGYNHSDINILLSLSDDYPYALAYVIIESIK